MSGATESIGNQVVSWADIPLNKYLAWLKMEDKHETGEDALSLISHFTDEPAEVLGERSMLEIRLLHLRYLSLLLEPNDFDAFTKRYWDSGLRAIPYMGAMYVFPSTIPNIVTETEQPMYDEPFGNWLEAMQFTKYYNMLVENGDMEALPFILAVLFRKKDEKIPLERVARDRWIKRRSDMFRSISMHYAWQALFFFIMPTALLLRVTQTYLVQQNQRATRQRKLKPQSNQ